MSIVIKDNQYKVIELLNNHIGDSIKLNNKWGELFQKIEIAYENGAGLEEIKEFEKELNELKTIQPNYKYISEIEDLLEETKANAENFVEYEAIKSETLANTGNKELATAIAWEFVYGI